MSIFFSSVFLIHMEEHLLDSVKMLSLTSARSISFISSFLLSLSHFSLLVGLIYFKLNWHTVFGKLTASCSQLDASFIDS